MAITNGEIKLGEQHKIPGLMKKKPNNSHLLPPTTLASVESLTMPLVQEVVLFADFQCSKCQKRVGDIISRMNGETESVVVSVLEKKVTLTFTTCTYPLPPPTQQQQQVAVYWKPLNKVAFIKRLFRSSTT